MESNEPVVSQEELAELFGELDDKSIVSYRDYCGGLGDDLGDGGPK
jgi:hypothetical protein